MQPYDEEDRFPIWEYTPPGPTEVPQSAETLSPVVLPPTTHVVSENRAGKEDPAAASVTTAHAGSASLLPTQAAQASRRWPKWPLILAVTVVVSLLLGGLASVSANSSTALLQMAQAGQSERFAGQQVHATATPPPASSSATRSTTATPAPTTAASVPSQGAVLAQDTFARQDQPGWGMASDGQVWGADANQQMFGIGSGTGILIGAGTGTYENAVLGPEHPDVSVLMRGQLNQFFGNGAVNLGVVARWSSTSDYDKAYLDGRHLILMKRVANRQKTLASVPFQAQGNTSYTLRLQVDGTQLSARAWKSTEAEPATWMVTAQDRNLTNGQAGIRVLLRQGVIATIHFFQVTATTSQGDMPTPAASVTPTTTAMPTPTATTPAPTATTGVTPATGTSQPTLVQQTLITDQAFGDGKTYVPNGWGIHKSRIVRTSTGDLFTSYISMGTGSRDRQFHVMHLTLGAGSWQDIKDGDAGTEPLNLVLGQQDSLHLFAWPGTQGPVQHLVSTDLGQTWTSESLAGQWGTDQGYATASSNTQGDLVVLLSGNEQPGTFLWSYYDHQSKQWQFHSTQIDQYRYTYAFVFPGTNHDLTIVAMRDVRRETLGYPAAPAGQFDYVFDAIKVFSIPDVRNPQPTSTLVTQVLPQRTTDADVAYLTDSYQDTQGRIHVLYNHLYDGPHHAIVAGGKVQSDVKLNLATGLGTKMRLLQDAESHFYLTTLDTNGNLDVFPESPSDTDGTQLAPMVQLDLGQLRGCSDADFCLSPTFTVERSGHVLSDVIDGVYGNFTNMSYVRLSLTGTSTIATPSPTARRAVDEGVS